MSGSGDRITVLTTGGTIDKVYARSGELEVGAAAVREILEQARTGLEITVESVISKDSLDLTDDDRAVLVRYLDEVTDPRVIITHGTDTMTDTAEYLLRHSPAADARTIVLTGAMQPAAMRDSDAPFNVGAALIAAQTLPGGVYVCMSGRVFPAGTVVKDRRLGRFIDRERRAEQGE